MWLLISFDLSPGARAAVLGLECRRGEHKEPMRGSASDTTGDYQGMPRETSKQPRTLHYIGGRILRLADTRRRILPCLYHTCRQDTTVREDVVWIGNKPERRPEEKKKVDVKR